MTVDVAEAGGTWSVLVGTGACRRSYEVTFGHVVEGRLTVHVNGHAVMVPVTGGRFHGRPRAGTGSGGPVTGALDVTAPMPGRIVRVLVAAGDVVAAGQGLVVVEAMKMENELRAPRAGVVREVRVAEGARVEAHVVLVVIE